MKIYAPIYIITLCRSEHFIREMESLRKNTWAKYTDVYIGLDYPAKESQWKGYREIKEYLQQTDFSCFASFSVIENEENIGAAKNSKKMRELVASKYDRWIVAEDDLEFSPNFLEYMNKCLEEYKEDPSIFAINGYSYPLKWVGETDATVLKQNGCCMAWGLGCWRDKLLKAEKELKAGCLSKEFVHAVRSKKLNMMSEARKIEYICHALSGNKEGLFFRCSDMALGIYIQLYDMCVVIPTMSKVRNHGFDGTGVYCGAIEKASNGHSMSYDYSHQPIDEETEFTITMATEKPDENRKVLDRFLFISAKDKIRAKLFMVGYHLIGQSKMEKIYQRLKGIMRG